ncbi:MAG: hypothetical protein M1814_002145 [Vezdaea aestivalis]|nr:MAG: hypothetical protein M1814_002145 [Vezdaea aestivalis]
MTDLQFKPPRRKGTPYRTPHEDDDFHDPRRQPSQRVNGPYSPGGGQYDRPPPLPRDPYSRSPSTRPDPYARSASAQSDPYARSPSAQPDPYSDPYASPQRGYNRTPGPSQSYSRPTPGPFLPPGALPQHTHPSIQQQQARSFSPSPQLGAAGYIHSPTSPAPLLQHHQVPTPPPQAQYRQRPETVYDSPFENPPTTAATPQQLYQPYSPTLPQEPAYKRSEYVEMPGSAPAPVPVHRGEGVVMELDAGPVPARGARPPSALTPGMRRAGNGHAF